MHPEQVDVAVIGGGIVGLSAARAIMARHDGARVCTPSAWRVSCSLDASSDRTVSVLNAPSPAATASLAIGAHIATVLLDGAATDV